VYLCVNDVSELYKHLLQAGVYCVTQPHTHCSPLNSFSKTLHFNALHPISVAHTHYFVVSTWLCDPIKIPFLPVIRPSNVDRGPMERQQTYHNDSFPTNFPPSSTPPLPSLNPPSPSVTFIPAFSGMPHFIYSRPGHDVKLHPYFHRHW